MIGSVLRWILRLVAIVLVAAIGTLGWSWLVPEPPPAAPRFDTAAIPDDIDSWLAMREAVFADLTPGTEKRIVWAKEPGTRTPLAVIYLHGFSATSEEIRPVPQEVARRLGANLYLARLAGHGRDGDAMAGARVEDWLHDLAEAMAVGSRIGDRLVIIGTSTGATLALAGIDTPGVAASLPGADRIAGLAFVSPNIRLRTAAGYLLDLPGVAHWGHLVAGRTREFTPINDDHALFWTTRYPTAALYPMARLMRVARRVAPGNMQLPLMLIWSDADMVISPEAANAVADQWAGTVTRLRVEPGEGVDPFNHVIAGDILSPAQTERVAKALADWAGGL